MAYTVWGAFDKFRKIVDLDATVTQQARTSRNYLFDQIKSLAQNNSDFPKLSGGYLAFGSFARKTKICPLDDIDILILLNGRGTTSQQSYSEPLKYFLKVTDYYCPLASFVDDFGFSPWCSINSLTSATRICAFSCSGYGCICRLLFMVFGCLQRHC